MDKLQEFRDDFHNDWSATEEVREMANEEFRFSTVPGGHWEGWLEDAYEDRAKLEIDHVSEYRDRTYTQWTQNRIGVNFQSSDESTDEAMEELADGLIRRDLQRKGGQASIDTAVREAMCPGYGCVILNTEWEDAGDPDNLKKNIVVSEQPNAYSTVFFDAAARREDKADAKHVTVLTPYSRKEFEARWPDAQPSTMLPRDRSTFNWATQELLYTATRYHKEERRTEVQVWTHPKSGEILRISKDEALSEADELAFAGFTFQRKKTIVKTCVYKTVFNGDSELEPTKKIHGEHLPVIPFYGHRYFVDGVEHFYGLIRKRMDAQRILNMNYSLLAEGAAHSHGDKPILAPEQVELPAVRESWSQNMHQNPYVLVEPLRDAQGNVIAQGALGMLPGSRLSSEAGALIDITKESLIRGTGGAPQDTIDPNASGKAINATIKRVDLNTGFIFDNINKSMKQLGTAWMSMAREVYSGHINRMVRIVTARGDSQPAVLNQKRGAGGNVLQVNDLSKGKFEVVVDTSKDYQSAKEETFENLRDILAAMSPQSPMRETIAMHLILMKDGQGLEDLQDFIKQQEIIAGRMKPQTPEDEQMLDQFKQAQQQQGIDPNSAYLMAAAAEQKTEAMVNQARVADLAASATKKAAEAEETKHDIALKKQKILAGFNPQVSQ